jgi:hypothetical protein
MSSDAESSEEETLDEISQTKVASVSSDTENEGWEKDEEDGEMVYTGHEKNRGETDNVRELKRNRRDARRESSDSEAPIGGRSEGGSKLRDNLDRVSLRSRLDELSSNLVGLTVDQIETEISDLVKRGLKLHVRRSTRRHRLSVSFEEPVLLEDETVRTAIAKTIVDAVRDMMNLLKQPSPVPTTLDGLEKERGTAVGTQMPVIVDRSFREDQLKIQQRVSELLSQIRSFEYSKTWAPRLKDSCEFFETVDQLTEVSDRNSAASLSQTLNEKVRDALLISHKFRQACEIQLELEELLRLGKTESGVTSENVEEKASFIFDHISNIRHTLRRYTNDEVPLDVLCDTDFGKYCDDFGHAVNFLLLRVGEEAKKSCPFLFEARHLFIVIGEIIAKAAAFVPVKVAELSNVSSELFFGLSYDIILTELEKLGCVDASISADTIYHLKLDFLMDLNKIFEGKKNWKTLTESPKFWSQIDEIQKLLSEVSEDSETPHLRRLLSVVDTLKSERFVARWSVEKNKADDRVVSFDKLKKEAMHLFDRLKQYVKESCHLRENLVLRVEDLKKAAKEDGARLPDIDSTSVHDIFARHIAKLLVFLKKVSVASPVHVDSLLTVQRDSILLPKFLRILNRDIGADASLLLSRLEKVVTSRKKKSDKVSSVVDTEILSRFEEIDAELDKYHKYIFTEIDKCAAKQMDLGKGLSTITTKLIKDLSELQIESSKRASLFRLLESEDDSGYELERRAEDVESLMHLVKLIKNNVSRNENLKKLFSKVDLVLNRESTRSFSKVSQPEIDGRLKRTLKVKKQVFDPSPAHHLSKLEQRHGTAMFDREIAVEYGKRVAEHSDCSRESLRTFILELDKSLRKLFDSSKKQAWILKLRAFAARCILLLHPGRRVSDHVGQAPRNSALTELEDRKIDVLASILEGLLKEFGSTERMSPSLSTETRIETAKVLAVFEANESIRREKYPLRHFDMSLDMYTSHFPCNGILQTEELKDLSVSNFSELMSHVDQTVSNFSELMSHVDQKVIDLEQVLKLSLLLKKVLISCALVAAGESPEGATFHSNPEVWSEIRDLFSSLPKPSRNLYLVVRLLHHICGSLPNVGHVKHLPGKKILHMLLNSNSAEILKRRIIPSFETRTRPTSKNSNADQKSTHELPTMYFEKRPASSSEFQTPFTFSPSPETSSSAKNEGTDRPTGKREHTNVQDESRSGASTPRRLNRSNRSVRTTTNLIRADDHDVSKAEKSVSDKNVPGEKMGLKKAWDWKYLSSEIDRRRGEMFSTKREDE